MNDNRRLAAFRQPPHNLEAEKALLGAIFVNDRAFEAVAGFLRPEHFAFDGHGRLFDACARLIGEGRVADPVTLKDFASTDPAFADMGGAAYLTEIAASAVTVINAREYGRLIRDHWLKRQLIVIAEDTLAGCHDSSDDADSIMVFLESALGALGGDPLAEPRSIGEFVAEALATTDARFKGERPALATGLADLDRLIGGLESGDLAVIAGATSMGKTGFAWHLTRTLTPALAYSLEMPGQQIGLRELARLSGIPLQDMRAADKRLTMDDFTRLAEAATVASVSPIWIDHRPQIGAIVAAARAWRRKHSIRALVVDYLQQVESPGETRTLEVSAASRALKRLAMDLGIIVVAVSQLKRGFENRDDHRPVLGDLRESGAIEQDADLVVFLHREAYYLERAVPNQKPGEDAEKFSQRLADHAAALERHRNRAEIIVAKQRNGPTGTAHVHFDPVRLTFANAYGG